MVSTLEFVALIPATVSPDDREVRRGCFTISSHKVLKKGKPRWEKRCYETLLDGTQRERRLGVWSLSMPVRLEPLLEPLKLDVTTKRLMGLEPSERLTVHADPTRLGLAYLEQLRWVWNEALGELIQFDTFYHYDRVSKTFCVCDPLVLQWHDADGYLVKVPITDRSYEWLNVTDTAVLKKDCFVDFPSLPADQRRRQGRLRTPYNSPRMKAQRAKWRPSCPIIVPRPESFVLDGFSDFSLYKAFSQKRFLERYPDRAWFKDLSVQVVRSVLKQLAKAWGEWRYPKVNGRRVGKPRFKSSKRGDRVSTLRFGDVTFDMKCSEQGLLQSIKLPKLGVVWLPERYARQWGDLPIQSLCLTYADAYGWYLSLTTTERVLPLVKDDNRTAQVEVVAQDGVLFTFNGKPRRIKLALYRGLDAQIAALKSQLTRQREAAKHLKGTPTYKGTGLKASVRQLRQLQRQLRLEARNEIVKLAAHAVAMGGNLSVADTKDVLGLESEPGVAVLPTVVNGSTRPLIKQVVNARMTLKPKPRPDDPAVPSWKPNGSTAVSDRNRERAQHRVGLLTTKLEQKSAEAGRTITVYVPVKEHQQRERQQTQQRQKQKQRQLVR